MPVLLKPGGTSRFERRKADRNPGDVPVAWSIQKGPAAPDVPPGVHSILRRHNTRNKAQSLGTTGTAVYGTVRTVVWEDGGRKPASYPNAFSHPLQMQTVVAVDLQRLVRHPLLHRNRLANPS